MIPKIIHYCWFGNNPKPDIFYKCLKSWKKYCPDYEIKEWNESNFDVNINTYIKEAYEEKKYAFVTDYARLWIIFNCGGIYLDTDVELIRPLDTLLNDCAFFGTEDGCHISTGLGFGAEKNNFFIELMMNDYNGIHFKNSDGTIDITTCPKRNTNSVKHLFKENTNFNNIYKLANATIYPREYFCPLSADGLNMNKTINTYAIHWFTATWLGTEEKVVHDYRMFRGKCQRVFGIKNGELITKFVYLFLPKKREILKRM